MAQNLILCQFCEKSKEIKWKCFTCDLVLCQKCAKQHSKFGGSEEHCIINLKQVGTPENVDIIQKSHLKNILCASHEKEKCSLFCKDCIIPVCSFCVIEPIHKSHNFDKLSTVYNNQLSELKDVKRWIEENLPELSNSVRESTTTCDNYNEIKQKIIQREREIKEKATKEAAILIDELDNLIIPSKDAFMEKKQRIQEREIKLKETYNEVDAALKSHQPTNVLASTNKVDRNSLLKMKSTDILVPLEQKFIFKLPDSPSINFGSVKKCPVLKVLNTFETNVLHITNIKSLKDGSLVCIYEIIEEENSYTCERTYYLGYVDEQGDKIIIKNDIFVPSSMSYADMTVTDDDMIVITMEHCGMQYMYAYDKTVKRFPVYRCSDSFIERILSIHSFDKTILVGCEEYDYVTNPGYGVWFVMILDKKGNCSKTLKIPENDRQISSIDKITKNINGDMIILDEHTVAVYDSNFEFKWSTNKTFNCPLRDIITTPKGQIIVADIYSIHVLSIEGEHLSSIGKEEGIYPPTCLHIDKNGQLLVGSKEENENAKIQVVKILD